MHVIIVSNGFPPSETLLKSEVSDAEFVIGADGGGNVLLKLGVEPQIVVGDMDSFEPPSDSGFEILKDPDQETNDLEKALKLALERGAESCTVLGAFGHRMDHALKNLSVLKQFHSHFHPLLFKDDKLSAFLVTDEYQGRLPVGSIISLFPLSGRVTGIHTTGLKYPLKGEKLENGLRDGTSNENVSPDFSIHVESGDLVVFTQRV